MSGVTTLVFENDRMHEVMGFLLTKGIPFYELVEFFEIEKFTTLEEVEAWWLNK